MTTARVKSGLLQTRDLASNAFKVVTERGVVYLMGRVTAQEAMIATEVAATTQGVVKVVRVLEIVTAEELMRTR
jgi:osmotically-inducible protein OsmY